MSEEAFRDKISREQSEIAPIEAALKDAREEVSGLEKVLDAQHKRVREAHDGLREYIDAHPTTKGESD